MLVLSRKLGESIVIDGDIVITVLEISGTRVSLGIRAPREKKVYRLELYEAIRAGDVNVDGVEVRELCAVG